MPRFLLCSSLDPATHVLVVKNDLTEAFIQEIKSILDSLGVEILPVETTEERHDVWVQDAIEIGVDENDEPQAIAGIRRLHFQTDLDPTHLDDRVVEVLQSAQVTILRPAEPRPNTRWIDWFGNLEVTPPVPNHPHGRALFGRQDDLAMHPDILKFLSDQGMQEPLELDVSWLAIGHVDEMTAFVPAANPAGFAVLMPSPELARQVLESHLTTAPEATSLRLSGTLEQLYNQTRSIENRTIQDSLDQTWTQLAEALTLPPEARIPIPVAFEGGASLWPNPVNGLILNGHAILPKPWGPEVEGQCLFEAAIRRNWNSTAHLRFLDCYKPYHVRGGEIHCGTNAIRRKKPTSRVPDSNAPQP